MSIYTEKFMDDDEEYYNPQPSINSRKTKKILSDPSKHYPNKDEASLLRKIMASTGLTEEEIRKDKKYCKMLSEAQKEGNIAKRTPSEKWAHMVIKDACKETGLAKEHPKTLEVIERLLKERKHGWGRREIFYNPPSTAKNLLANYGKTYK